METTRTSAFVWHFGRPATLLTAALIGALTCTSPTLCAQEAGTNDQATAAELAKKLQNPIAGLISVETALRA